MQLTYRYLATNKAILLVDLASNITEYKPVYSRHLQVYRGIDNTLTFEIKNHDQKSLSTQTLATFTLNSSGTQSACVACFLTH